MKAGNENKIKRKTNQRKIKIKKVRLNKSTIWEVKAPIKIFYS
jgi:hypothetical protein